MRYVLESTLEEVRCSHLNPNGQGRDDNVVGSASLSFTDEVCQLNDNTAQFPTFDHMHNGPLKESAREGRKLDRPI